MGTRSEELAKKFDASCGEMNKTVEALSDAEWKKVTSAEKWPVGVVAHHVAVSHEGISGLVQLVAKGQPLPSLTMDMIHAGNAQPKSRPTSPRPRRWRSSRRTAARPAGSSAASATPGSIRAPACSW